MSKLSRVGVIGLGAMGLPILETLSRKGFPAVGYDVSHERRGRAASAVASISDCVAASDIVLLSLPSSREVEQVVEGRHGILEAAQPGHVIVDASTAHPESTRRLQRLCAGRGVGFVDAPVSGGPKGAADGKLLVMAGGADADVLRAMPVLEALARQVVRCGGPGSGNVVKLVNNLLCAANLALLGEALALAEAAGVEPQAVAAALAVGSGRSGVTEVHLPNWILSGRFDSGFTMGLMRKDVALAADVARNLDRVGPVSKAVAEAWEGSRRALADAEDFNRMAELAWRKR